MFIVIEGIDTSGKSSLVSALRLLLADIHPPVVFTMEPPRGYGRTHEAITRLLLDKTMSLSHDSQALLFALSRQIHTQEIIAPALAEGKIVISDRYFFSSWAYQSTDTGPSLERIKQLNDLFCSQYYPDLIIYLDLPVDLIQQRRGLIDSDRFEAQGIAFLAAVAERYNHCLIVYPQRYLPPHTQVLRVDATQPLEEMINVVSAHVLALINRQGGE